MRENESLDLHGMSVQEAQLELDYFLDYLDEYTDEVTIVHGYKQGSALMNMVRQTYKHPRIKQKILSMNQGITIFLLKQE